MAAEKSSESKCRTRRVTGNCDDDHKYRFGPYQQSTLNAIPKGQSSAIMSQRSCDEWHDLTLESAIPRTERQLRVSTVATTFIYLELSSLTSMVVYTYFSNQLEEAGVERKPHMQFGKCHNGNDKKSNFQPFTSEPAENTSGNSNSSNNVKYSTSPDPGNSKSIKSNKTCGGRSVNLSPAPWL